MVFGGVGLPVQEVRFSFKRNMRLGVPFGINNVGVLSQLSEHVNVDERLVLALRVPTLAGPEGKSTDGSLMGVV